MERRGRAVANYSGSKKQRLEYNDQVPSGAKGFIVSANRPLRIKQAMKEVARIIKVITKNAQPAEVPAQQPEGSADFQSALDSELAAVSAQAKDDFGFYEICRGVGFVAVKIDGVVPSLLCTQICEHVRSDPEVRIRDAVRIVPMDIVISPPTMNAFLCNPKAIDYVIGLFPQRSGPTASAATDNATAPGSRLVVEDSWKCELNRRNNSVGSRLFWYDLAHAASLGASAEKIREVCALDEKTADCPKLGELITGLKANDAKNPYKIVMTNPGRVIFFEANPKFIGCSIGERFDEFLKFNLSTIAGPASSAGGESPKQPDLSS